MEEICARARAAAPSGVDAMRVRVLDERHEGLSVQRGRPVPPTLAVDRGAMVSVRVGRGLGAAATADLSLSGLRAAAARAAEWARASAPHSLVDHAAVEVPLPAVRWVGPAARPPENLPLDLRFARLHDWSAALGRDAALVDREAAVWTGHVRSALVEIGGGEVYQELRFIAPDLRVVAARGAEVQTRSLGLAGLTQQGGWERLDALGLDARAARLGAEVLQLLDAPECPDGVHDLVLDPEQMMLQVHESIGHPLEGDRVLGDERNFAGRSFVRPADVGVLAYGSPALTVSFDPGLPEALASYAVDDEGTPATRALLIDKGRLVRLLAGRTSQVRGGFPGVACARAAAWWRAPIDRMANVNIEPGDTPFPALIAQVEDGVYMATNRSWSIDDSRNKFQFVCEWGERIRGGQRVGVVKNPGYRGVSASFWRSLVAVGTAAERQVLGTPYCGKGEPAQLIRVGHACPPALFRGVEVFGGGVRR